ncbi:MAG: FG-GAP repeat domain-containing protein, partial [Planctomyces sp.]
MAANLINRISGLFHGDLAANRRPRRSRCSVAESLEQRRLLSAAPRVQSLSPVDIEARTSATWSLRFSEPVTGVDMTDFQVTPDAGVTWQSIDVRGSGDSRSITVAGLSGAGKVRLDLVDDGSIRDPDGNPLYGSSGIFLEPVRAPGAALHYENLLTADFDGDGRSEVVFAESPADRGPWTVTRLDVATDGTSTQSSISLIDSTAAPLRVMAQDVTGDGRPELLVVEYTGMLSVHSLAEDGTSTLLSAADLNGIEGKPIWYGPGDAVFSDLNNDGLLDLALEYDNYSTRSLRILTGNNEGQFFPGQLIDFPNSIFAPVQDLLAGDVNKDGLNDLLFRETSRTDDGIINYRGHVMLGTIPGELVDTGVFFEGPENNGGITRLFDMDGDLNPDLITTNQDLGLCVYPGMGDGTFAAPIPVGFDGSDRVRINPFEIVITSDGDATSNLLLFSTAIDPVSGYQQDVTRVTLFQQNAAGQYQLASQLDVAGSVVPLKRTGLQSRLNSQHGLELRVSRYDKSTEQTSILFQRLDISPTGQLSSSQILSLPGRIDQTADGDFDGDGITDTVFVGDSPYGSLDSTGITLLLRNPAQQSGDPVRATISRGEGAGNRPSALLAADIDGDSALDVLSVSQSTNTLNLSRGLGTGLFLPTQRFSVGQGPVGVATLDFNHDGLQDAVTANSLDGTLTFLK